MLTGIYCLKTPSLEHILVITFIWENHITIFYIYICIYVYICIGLSEYLQIVAWC